MSLAVEALRELVEEARSSGCFGAGRGRRSGRLVESWRVAIERGSGCGIVVGSAVGIAVDSDTGAGSGMRFGCCWGRMLGSGSRDVRGVGTRQCCVDALLRRRNDCALLGGTGM